MPFGGNDDDDDGRDTMEAVRGDNDVAIGIATQRNAMVIYESPPSLRREVQIG